MSEKDRSPSSQVDAMVSRAKTDLTYFAKTVSNVELHPYQKRIIDFSDGCLCQNCGCIYRVDINVPNGLWKEIKPINKPNESGLLCGVCIAFKIEQRVDSLPRGVAERSFELIRT